MLLTSTSEVYGDPEVHPQKETYWGHVNPIGAYLLRMDLGISVYFGCRGEKHPGLQLGRQRGEKRDEEIEKERERELERKRWKDGLKNR